MVRGAPTNLKYLVVSKGYEFKVALEKADWPILIKLYGERLRASIWLPFGAGDLHGVMHPLEHNSRDRTRPIPLYSASFPGSSQRWNA